MGPTAEQLSLEEPDFSFKPVDPSNGVTLPREQIEFYNENGYLFPFTIFDGQSVIENRRGIDRLMEMLAAEEDGRDNYALLGYHTRCEILYRLVTSPKILDIAQDLIGPDIVCWSSHLFCKVAGDRKRVPFHQDAAYWCLSPVSSITIWLAIDDSDIHNSCMQVIPKSHLRGKLPWKKATDDVVLDLEVVNPEGYDSPVPVTLKAGEISIHSDLLAHGSNPNDSNARRCGFAIRYCAPRVRASDPTWRNNAVLCRGTDNTENWNYPEKPEGDSVTSWVMYHWANRHKRS